MIDFTFIQCGGTIDKDYPRTSGGYAFEFGEPAVKRILEQISPSFTFEIVPLLQKDSLDMDDNDRLRLVEACNRAGCARIIVSHGTDTMMQSAESLSRIKSKTVVLTGSRLPERFKGSDAAFNLGMSVAAAQILPPGVYIAMNGRIFSWEKVCREPESGRFVPIP